MNGQSTLAKITFGPQGIKAARGSAHPRKPGKRGKVNSWSAGAARRNMDFLKSIHVPELSGYAYGFTLTLRNAPPTPEAWEALRRALVERMRRDGMIRLHWVTEWQTRQRQHVRHLGPAPHFHGIAFYGGPNKKDLWPHMTIIMHWLELAEEYGVSFDAQKIDYASPEIGIGGWLYYLTKHMSRGEKHMQRGTNLPNGWTKTGRMWGHSGEWPRREAAFIVTDDLFWRFRRVVQKSLISKRKAELQHARKELWGDIQQKRIKNLRSSLLYLQNRLRKSSEISPHISVSEWMDPKISERWFEQMARPFEHVTSSGEVTTQWDMCDLK